MVKCTIYLGPFILKKSYDLLLSLTNIVMAQFPSRYVLFLEWILPEVSGAKNKRSRWISLELCQSKRGHDPRSWCKGDEKPDTIPLHFGTIQKDVHLRYFLDFFFYGRRLIHRSLRSSDKFHLNRSSELLFANLIHVGACA